MRIVFFRPVLIAVGAAWLLGGHTDAGAARLSGTRKSSPSGGGWLEKRGRTDPRPYRDGLLFDGVPGAGFFQEKAKRWKDQGLAVGGYASANTQWGSEGGPAHNISEFLLIGTWEPLHRANDAGRIQFGLAHDQTFGQPTTRVFSDRQGLVEAPNDLDTDPDLTFTTLGMLFWEYENQTGPAQGWAFRAGQLYGPSYYGVATYLDDDRRYFMARPLAAAAGAQWIGFNDIGLGVNVITWKAPWYVSGMIIDGKANRTFPDFSSFMDSRFLYVLEVGFEYDPDGPDELAVRLTGSHLDLHDGDAPAEGTGQAVMLSAVKRFGGEWAVAARWSKSYRRLSADYRELFSLGVLWLKSFGRPLDFLALGVFSGDPSDGARGIESGFELAYNLQISQAVNVMPDLQYWHRDDDGGPRTRTWIAGLRLNFEY